MSVVFSGTNQGFFTSTGATTNLHVRADVDYIRVYNTTQLAASQTTATGVEYYWQRGFPQGAMIKYFKSNAANAANLSQYLTTNGFYLINNTINIPGASTAITSISSASPPVVATGTTAGLVSGSSIVRIFSDVAAGGISQLGGLDFTAGGVIASTSFTLAYMAANNVAASGAGTGGIVGHYRIIPYDPYFYPPTRVIANISNATQAIITFTVNHTFTVGQAVRILIPTVTSVAYGMTQLNGAYATIVAINQADGNGYTNTITVNIDTTAFGTFQWPLTTDPVHTPAQVVPIGENTAQAISSGVNVLGDSEVNLGYLGIALTGGAGNPGGATNEVMYWVAGKSFSGGA